MTGSNTDARWLAWTLCGALAWAGLTSCSDEPRVPRAGQRVKPYTYMPAFRLIRPKTPVVSLYEYYDKEKYLTTGKSISFSLPREYISYPADANGGPQLTVGLMYLRIASPNGDRFRPVSSIERKSGVPKEELTLHPYEFEPHTLTKNDFDKGLSPPGLSGLPGGARLSRVTADHCNFEVFSNIAPPPSWQRTIYDANGSSNLPYKSGVAFARSIGYLKFNPVVFCTIDTRRNWFPICVVNTTFRGWPMKISFGGDKVCETDKIIAGARDFLDQHSVRETERGAGFVESRYINFAKEGP